MQEKKDRTQNFLDRFNALCVQSGIKTAEACRVIGISRSLFYSLRAGKRDVTEKMEKRLGIAEREADLAAPLNLSLARARTDAERAEILRVKGASLHETLEAYPAGSYMWTMELQEALGEFDMELALFTKNTRELCRLSRLAGELITGKGNPAAEILPLSKKVAEHSSQIELMRRDFFPALFAVAEKAQREAKNKESHGAK